MRATLLVILLAAGTAGAGDTKLTVQPHKGFPPVESVEVYRTADGKREKVAEATRFAAPLAVPAGVPLEVWVRCEGGLAVKLPDALTLAADRTHDLKIGAVLGVVEVFGDDFPRAGKVVLTDPRDPGPGEKGHVAIQTAGEYRVGMCAPPGVYAVWVVPANGAKPQRVADRVRVSAGRVVRVGDGE